MPVLLVGLGPEAGAILARTKSLWAKYGGSGKVLAVGSAIGADLDIAEVLPLDGAHFELPKIPIGQAIATVGPTGEVLVVADLAESEAEFLEAMASLARSGLGPRGRLAAVLIVPAEDSGSRQRDQAGRILARLWPSPRRAHLFERLYLAEGQSETGRPIDPITLRDRIALRLALEGIPWDAAARLRAHADRFEPGVRSFGAGYWQVPTNPLARLLGARFVIKVLTAWIGSESAPLPEITVLPPPEVVLDLGTVTEEGKAEIEALIDEVLWVARAGEPAHKSFAAALQTEVIAQLPAASETLPVALAAVQAPVRRVIEQWHSRMNTGVEKVCQPEFQDGHGLEAALSWLRSLSGSFESAAALLSERLALLNERVEEAKQRLDATTKGFGKKRSKAILVRRGGVVALADCRRALQRYTMSLAERWAIFELAAEVQALQTELPKLQTRLTSLHGFLNATVQLLDSQAQEASVGWDGPHTPNFGDLETLYREVVGPLPDEEDHFEGLHETLLGGARPLDFPLSDDNPLQLANRLLDAALDRLVALKDLTFGKSLALSGGSAALYSEVLRPLFEDAAPMLRIRSGGDGAIPGQAVCTVAREPNPPDSLATALRRLGLIDTDCSDLPADLAASLIIWTERGGISPADIIAVEYLPGAWPLESAASSLGPEMA